MSIEDIADLIREALLEHPSFLHVDAADAANGVLGVAMACGDVFAITIEKGDAA